MFTAIFAKYRSQISWLSISLVILAGSCFTVWWKTKNYYELKLQELKLSVEAESASESARTVAVSKAIDESIVLSSVEEKSSLVEAVEIQKERIRAIIEDIRVNPIYVEAPHNDIQPIRENNDTFDGSTHDRTSVKSDNGQPERRVEPVDVIHVSESNTPQPEVNDYVHPRVLRTIIDGMWDNYCYEMENGDSCAK